VLRDLGFQEAVEGRLDQLTQEGGVVDQRLTRAGWQAHIPELSHRSLRSEVGFSPMPILLEERWLATYSPGRANHGFQSLRGAVTWNEGVAFYALVRNSLTGQFGQDRIALRRVVTHFQPNR
jgi:hypothetical protein